MMSEALKNKGRTRNRLLALAVAVFTLSVTASAQRNTGRLSLGAGLLYRNGMDLTLAYEHETNYGYLQWKDCETCGHICPESFWQNYRTYGFGVAYKPCVVRGRNHYGNLRIGVSGGSDTKRFLGGIHLGYEHNYVLRSGWVFFWQVKGDVMIKGADLLRAGVVLGVKLPVK